MGMTFNTCAFRFVDEHYIPTNSLVLTELREQLCASVRRHLLAEVPFGLLLSGGLDSSLVAAIACRENKRLGHGEVLKSFCIGLKGSPDLAAAEQVRGHSCHHCFSLITRLLT